MPHNAIEPDVLVSVPAHVKCRVFDDELVVLDLERGEYLALNATATSVWTALTRGLTPREASQLVATEFDVDAEQALADCIALAGDLVRRGLLERR